MLNLCLLIPGGRLMAGSYSHTNSMYPPSSRGNSNFGTPGKGTGLSPHLPGKMNAAQLQSLAPTPTLSDISSIHPTPRHLPPTSESQNEPYRDNFLAPGKFCPGGESWNQFKVLPNVGTSANPNNNPSNQNSGGTNPESGAALPMSSLSHYLGSATPLSPFLIPDFSPMGSMVTSPRNSAHLRMAKKRALSISPLSSEGLDLNALIRFSPSLTGSRAGSNSLHNAAVPQGSVGHLAAHIWASNSPPGSQYSTFSRPGNFKKDIDEESSMNLMGYLEMGNLQGQPQQAMMANNVVVPQQYNMSYGPPQASAPHSVYPMRFKQEPFSEDSNMGPLQSNLQEGPLEGSMPPPPPYPDISRSPFDSNTQVGGGDKGEVVEDGSKVHACKWIDCNQVR